MERVLRRDRLVLVALITTLIVLAGLYTILGVGMRMTALDMTAMRGMRDMPGPGTAGAWSLSYTFIVFLMWWVMMVAMMLPSVTPTLLLHAELLRHVGVVAQVPFVTGMFLGGYLLTWAGFSAVATVTQWALESAGLLSTTMMILIDTWPGGLVLIAAGAFQFTPFKAACLEHCRSPARFLTERRRPGTKGAFMMGMEHGVYCVGCCWFLMALLFVGGIMNLYWIVGLAALVTIEKLTPWGSMTAKVTGAVLATWGVWVVTSSI